MSRAAVGSSRSSTLGPMAHRPSDFQELARSGPKRGDSGAKGQTEGRSAAKRLFALVRARVSPMASKDSEMFSATVSSAHKGSVLVCRHESQAPCLLMPPRERECTRDRDRAGVRVRTPAAILMSVDFPDPFSPTSACTSPGPAVEVNVGQRLDAREGL